MLTIETPKPYRFPSYFRPARNPRSVMEVPFTQSDGRRSAAQAAGLRYEKKWHAAARNLWGERYRTFEGSALTFADYDGHRMCRPDGLLWFADRLSACIFEVKLKHTMDAFYQLCALYRPVLQVMHPGVKFYVCEVYKVWDFVPVGAARELNSPLDFDFQVDLSEHYNFLRWTAQK